MAKRIMQFRYYSKGDEKNSPHYITIAGLTTGQIFRDFLPMSHLGIQTLPGTRFYLNGNTYPVIVGHSGLYELELDDKCVLPLYRLMVNPFKQLKKTLMVI